ncbi:hypothetical protein DFH94DRAFT_332899 [Russula ochroleuca]|uniref:Uncharacterized protein n=1 Tax=Russula ochroleuca TaxID=152965 RepID=A0A9P5N1T4_9AGAM|nr:hypothetical protein DFH94DRAFT_332899 [Russula ochroleuca]
MPNVNMVDLFILNVPMRAVQPDEHAQQEGMDGGRGMHGLLVTWYGCGNASRLQQRLVVHDCGNTLWRVSLVLTRLNGTGKRHARVCRRHPAILQGKLWPSPGMRGRQSTPKKTIKWGLLLFLSKVHSPAMHCHSLRWYTTQICRSTPQASPRT